MANEIQNLGVAGLTVETRTWYEKVLQGRNEPEYKHEMFGMKKSIPARGGNNINIRQFTRPAAATTALVEGTPPSVTGVTVTGVTISVAQYGAYMLGSDVVETQAIDPQLTEWSAVFSEMKNDTRDKVVRSFITAGTNVAWTNGATVRSGIASGSAYNLAWADLRAARKALKRVDVPALVDGKYGAIIHPDVTANLFADSTVVNAFQNAQNRGDSNPLFKGELGDLLGIRFFETSNAMTFSGLGQSASFVYATLFLGKDGYAVTEYSAASDEIIFHAAGTSGIKDPLNQCWSLGFKTAIGAGIVDQTRVLRYESNG
jgi:N4-gp56 family major capsid protein